MTNNNKILEIKLPDVILYPAEIANSNGQLAIARYTEAESRAARLSKEQIDELIGYVLTNPIVISKTKDKITVIADYDFPH